MMKNNFYFTLKALSVVKKNDLRRKLNFSAKLMTSQTEKQIITIHILPSILRIKGKQAIKFG